MKRTVFIAVIVVIVFGGITAYFFHRPLASQTTGENKEGVNVKEDQAAVLSSPMAARYANNKYGFSFDKPEGYTVGDLHDETGEILVIQKTNSRVNDGFQIYITPLDEPLTLTPDRIHADLPDLQIKNAKNIQLDAKASGIMFESNSSDFGGKSFEIWFTYQGFLYQITSYQSFANDLQKIIGTWKFED